MDAYNRSTQALAPAVRGPCYAVGDAVSIGLAVTNAAGAPTDPAAASFAVLDPAGVQSTHPWPGDSAVSHGGAGQLTLALVAASSGRYHWRGWVADGDPAVPAQAQADSFDVAQTPLVPGPAPQH